MNARRGQFTIRACKFPLMYFQEFHQATWCPCLWREIHRGEKKKKKLDKSKAGCLVGSVWQKQNFVLNMNTRVRHKTSKAHGALITGIPCFIVLCFMVLQREGIIYKLNVCGKPARSKSVSTVFVNVLSLRTLVSLTIFQAFSLWWYLLWWSVGFDVNIVKWLQLAGRADIGEHFSVIIFNLKKNPCCYIL